MCFTYCKENIVWSTLSTEGIHNDRSKLGWNKDTVKCYKSLYGFFLCGTKYKYSTLPHQ